MKKVACLGFALAVVIPGCSEQPADLDTALDARRSDTSESQPGLKITAEGHRIIAPIEYRGFQPSSLLLIDPDEKPKTPEEIRKSLPSWAEGITPQRDHGVFYIYNPPDGCRIPSSTDALSGFAFWISHGAQDGRVCMQLDDHVWVEVPPVGARNLRRGGTVIPSIGRHALRALYRRGSEVYSDQVTYMGY